MSDSVTLEQVLQLAKQLSPLDRIRLIEQITPQLKRDFVVSPSQPPTSLKDIWKAIDLTGENIAEIKAEMKNQISSEKI